MNYFDLCKTIISGDKKEFLGFLQAKKLILEEKNCPICNSCAKLEIRSSGKPRWRCCKRGQNSHEWKESILKNTVFESSHLDLLELIRFFYFFSVGHIDYNFLKRELKWSNQTVCQWLLYCREICFAFLDIFMEKEGLIGGEGIIVEVDETKIGKRKYERGRLKEGHWLIGMIELQTGEQGKKRRGGRFRLEFCPENKRDTDSLITLIKKHVLPGTTIMTDCWGAYISLSSHGYNHLTVNHTQNFVDPDTWANTQTIESTWRHLKKKICKGGITHENLDLHLCEHLFGLYVKLHEKDPFEEFLYACSTVYNPQ